MSKSDALFRLIHSMSSSEKRYFKRNSKMQKEESRYLDLFDAMVKAKESDVYKRPLRSYAAPKYTEDFFVKRLKAANMKEGLHSYKNNLYKNILKSLRDYHTKNSIKLKMLDHFAAIQLLTDKNLIDQAQARLAKAKTFAKANHYHTYFLELLLLERKFIRRIKPNQATKQLNPISIECIQSLRIIDDHIKILEVYEPLHLGVRHENIDQAAAESINEKVNNLINANLEEELLSQALSFRPLIDLYLLYFNYHYSKSNFEDSLSYLLKIIVLFEGQKNMIIEEPSRYVRMVINYLTICLRLHKYQDIPFHLSTLRKLPLDRSKGGMEISDDYTNLQIFVHTYSIELRYFMRIKEIKKAVLLVKEINTKINFFEKDSPKAELFSLYHNISMAYFIDEDYSKVLDWTNRIQSLEGAKGVKVAVQFLSYILMLVSHYTLGNDSLVIYKLVPSIRNLIKKMEKNASISPLIPEIKLLVKSMRAASKTPSNKERREIFKTLLNELNDKWQSEELGQVVNWIKKQAEKN